MILEERDGTMLRWACDRCKVERTVFNGRCEVQNERGLFHFCAGCVEHEKIVERTDLTMAFIMLMFNGSKVTEQDPVEAMAVAFSGWMNWMRCGADLIKRMHDIEIALEQGDIERAKELAVVPEEYEPNRIACEPGTKIHGPFGSFGTVIISRKVAAS